MSLFINSLKKTPAVIAGVFVSLLIVSCGSSYRGVANGSDGIYESNSANNRAVIAQRNPTPTSDSYFTKKLEEYEQAASSGDVLTDIEGYSSDYYGDYDDTQDNYGGENYQAWGENAQQSSQVYNNVGYNNYGYNNYYNPFWNRGYRNYGYGYGYYGGGPYYNNYNYGWGGSAFLFGGFYGGAYWGNNIWFGNRWGRSRGYYNNNRVVYGRRSYSRLNNRRAVNNNVRRNLSGRNTSARTTNGRINSRSTNSRRTYNSRSNNGRNYSTRGTSTRQSSSSSARRSSNSSIEVTVLVHQIVEVLLLQGEVAVVEVLQVVADHTEEDNKGIAYL